MASYRLASSSVVLYPLVTVLGVSCLVFDNSPDVSLSVRSGEQQVAHSFSHTTRLIHHVERIPRDEERKYVVKHHEAKGHLL